MHWERLVQFKQEREHTVLTEDADFGWNHMYAVSLAYCLSGYRSWNVSQHALGGRDNSPSHG